MKIERKSRNLFLGIVLGDGYLAPDGSMCILHKASNKDYLEWKRKLLIGSGFRCSPLRYKDNNGFPSYSIYVGVSRWGKLVRKLLYRGGKKNYFNRKLLNRLSPLELAILYMDDGSISTKVDSSGKERASVLTISTCTTRENNQILIDYFQDVWGIRFGQRKMKNQYALICGTREARKFIEVIREYVGQVPSMAYKLKVKSETIP